MSRLTGCLGGPGECAFDCCNDLCDTFCETGIGCNLCYCDNSLQSPPPPPPPPPDTQLIAYNACIDSYTDLWNTNAYDPFYLSQSPPIYYTYRQVLSIEYCGHAIVEVCMLSNTPTGSWIGMYAYWDNWRTATCYNAHYGR